MIPMFLRLVILEEESDKRGVNIWLPLFLLWILLLPLFVLILVVWFFSHLAVRASHASGCTVTLLEAAAAILWNMNGLRVDIHNRKSRFVLHF